VYDFCVRMVGDREEAFDLTQEIFISIHQHLDKFRADAKLTTWIFRISRNHCLNRIKYLKRRGRGRSEEFGETNELSITESLGGSSRPDEHGYRSLGIRVDIVKAATEAPPVACQLRLPAYDAATPYRNLAHLSNADTYFEDFTAGDVIEHSRGRTMTSEHIALTAMLDNTSQVHCNQYMIDQNPERFVGGQLIIFGGIPFQLCLGLSCPDVADNSLGDIVYKTGRHPAPLLAGDTVFASTEIVATRDLPGRSDLGALDTILRGHKFVTRDGATEKVEIFYLERSIAVKRRSHYA
jgi:RNA polymerase sigma factor (sigma-70 family)